MKVLSGSLAGVSIVTLDSGGKLLLWKVWLRGSSPAHCCGCSAWLWGSVLMLGVEESDSPLLPSWIVPG